MERGAGFSRMRYRASVSMGAGRLGVRVSLGGLRRSWAGLEAGAAREFRWKRSLKVARTGGRGGEGCRTLEPRARPLPPEDQGAVAAAVFGSSFALGGSVVGRSEGDRPQALRGDGEAETSWATRVSNQGQGRLGDLPGIYSGSQYLPLP